MATRSFLSMLQKRWFLSALVVVIGGGMFLGPYLPDQTAEMVARLIRTKIITAFVLFLMAFSLASRQLGTALRSPGPVVWAIAVNMGLLPALTWCLMGIQQTPDFRIGLLIAGSVPCTVAAASVWTRKAGGNDAVALLVTLLTNGTCFLITPFWLNTALANRSVQLDAGTMVADLAVVVLLPTVLGQTLRRISSAAEFARRRKIPIGVVAQLLILSVIFRASCDAGRRIDAFESGMSWISLVLVWGTCIGVHLTGMGLGISGARRLGFSLADQAAVAFASSQKTLPIGILLATDRSMFGDPDILGPGMGIPFAVFPILMYHVSQLFIDTLVADRLLERAQRLNAPREKVGNDSQANQPR